MNATDYEFVSWEFVMESVEKIVEAIKEKEYSGIFAMPRGGLCLGAILSYQTKLPLLLHAAKDCVVIDDISDVGKTLYHYANKYFIVTLYYRKGSLVIPNLWFKEKTEKWVVFPWENQKDPE